MNKVEDAVRVPYSDCLQHAAQLWYAPKFENVLVDQEATIAIARILYRVANNNAEPPQVLADLDDETREALGDYFNG